jgi:hypothetical protein
MIAPVRSAALVLASFVLLVVLIRIQARQRRQYVRLDVIPYRGDDPTAAAVVNMFEALHKRLLHRWWRRLFTGQPSVALEVHCDRKAWLSLTCPAGLEPFVEAACAAHTPTVAWPEPPAYRDHRHMCCV